MITIFCDVIRVNVMKKFVAVFGLMLGLSATVQADRATDVINAIQQWNAPLSSVDRQGKYCRMAESAFTFYRGSNHLFWQDFSNDPRLNQFSSSRTVTWLQGDLHANNYGAFDDDKGTVVYELNDFDESVLANYQYDIWRMATSILLIARENDGFSNSDQEIFVDAFTENYLDTIADVRGNSSETSITLNASNTYGLLDDFLRDVEQSQSRVKMLDQWTNLSSSSRIFDLTDERLSAISSTTRNAIINQMSHYGNTLSGALSYNTSYFRVKDIAQRKLAGIGSFGTPRFYVLIEGPTNSASDDRILDVKLQRSPTPYRFLGTSFQSQYNSQFINHASRHAIAFNALTRRTDDHVGWMSFNGGAYSVRERTAFRETFDTSDLTSQTRMINLAEQWGAALAYAHARSDRDGNANFINYSFDTEVDNLTDGSHSEFRALVRSIAFNYAELVASDYATFLSVFPSNCN